MRTVGRYLRPYLARISLQMLIKISGTVVELFLPAMLASIIDVHAAKGDLQGVWLTGAAMVVCAFLAWLGSFVAQVYTKNKVAGIILQGASCITVTIMIISILLLPALNIATQA